MELTQQGAGAEPRWAKPPKSGDYTRSRWRRATAIDLAFYAYFTLPTRTRQNCLVLSCPCWWCELNWRQDKIFVLFRVSTHFLICNCPVSNVLRTTENSGGGKGTMRGMCPGRHCAGNGIWRGENMELWNLAASGELRLHCRHSPVLAPRPLIVSASCPRTKQWVHQETTLLIWQNIQLL